MTHTLRITPTADHDRCVCVCLPPVTPRLSDDLHLDQSVSYKRPSTGSANSSTKGTQSAQYIHCMSSYNNIIYNLLGWVCHTLSCQLVRALKFRKLQ